MVVLCFSFFEVGVLLSPVVLLAPHCRQQYAPFPPGPPPAQVIRSASRLPVVNPSPSQCFCWQTLIDRRIFRSAFWLFVPSFRLDASPFPFTRSLLKPPYFFFPEIFSNLLIPPMHVFVRSSLLTPPFPNLWSHPQVSSSFPGGPRHLCCSNDI